MQYYCHNCESYPLYLSEVSSSDSPQFDKPCCPYCGSIQLQKYERSEESGGTEIIYQDKGAWWVKQATPGWLDILGPFPSKEKAYQRIGKKIPMPTPPKPKIYQDRGAWWVEKITPGLRTILGPYPTKEEAFQGLKDSSN